MPRRSAKRPTQPHLTMDHLDRIGEFERVEKDGILLLRGPMCPTQGKRPQAVLISGLRRAVELLADLQPPPSYAPELRAVLDETRGA